MSFADAPRPSKTRYGARMLSVAIASRYFSPEVASRATANTFR